MASFTTGIPFCKVLTDNKIYANMSTLCILTIHNILLIFTLVLCNDLVIGVLDFHIYEMI